MPIVFDGNIHNYMQRDLY